MMTMTQKERIQAALSHKEVDRVPFGMWYHMPHVDQDAVALAEAQIQMAQDYDLDFIKMMPFGNYQAADYGLSCTYYCTPTKAVFERKFAIEAVEEWGNVHELPGCFGNHGKTLLAAQQIAHQQKKKGLEIPFVQTVFSPLTIAKKLAGDRIFDDMRKEPALLHHALSEIAKTCVNFMKENVDVGVSGFFFATQCATYDLMTEDEYREFGMKYDLQVLNAVKDATYFNIVHIHGDHAMFDLLSSYPVNAVNWHDRWVAPNLAEARKRTDKCLMGGINEGWLHTASLPEIRTHVEQALQMAGRTGFILTPGCCASMETPKENILAVRDALKALCADTSVFA